ncbi:unnamed protein product [Caenorhabditis angaria]|uniref:G-protein coupled receptors family 1 profile domain-containing protein n=1 Tax=Caenorhabditis angaria TaxID=860376 RepID=A0A9P1N2V0_9PELO|nr:unnamed protein product [Caenorhabditis angaria]
MFDFLFAFAIVHSTIAIIGMLFNTILIYLAMFKTPQIIRSYATLIINFALTDFFACFFDFFVQQRIIPAGKTLGYVSNGFCKYISPKACYVGYSLMLHFFSHSLWSLLLSFSYRYYILFYPAPRRITLLIIVFLIYQPSLFQWIVLLWSQDDTKDILAVLKVKFPNYTFHEDQMVTGTLDILRFGTMFPILHMTLPVTPVYACILILRNRIIKRLSEQTSSLSQKTKKLHKQLLMALSFQALLPGFFLIAVSSYAVGQLNIYHHPFFEYLTYSSSVFIPFLTPVSSFIFVTPYRQFLTSIFSKDTKVKDTKPQQNNSTSFHTASAVSSKK